MAKKLTVKIVKKADGYYEIKHKCALRLWKSSQKLLGAIPNRFTDVHCAQEALTRMGKSKNLELDIVIDE